MNGLSLKVGLISLLLGLSGGVAGAQTWRYSGTNSLWSTPSNWGGTLPANDGTADLLFSLNSSFTSEMDQNWNIRSITWNPTALSGGQVALQSSTAALTLTLQSGASNISGGQVSLNPGIVLAGPVVWNDTSTPGSFFSTTPGTLVYGPVSGPGGFQKTGAGLLRLLNETNSFTGGITVSGGVLEVPSDGALGTNAAIQLDGGALRFYTPALAPALTTAKNLVVGAAGGTLQARNTDLTITGAISGAGQLSLTADPAWTFNASRFFISGTNSHAGGTVLSAVTLQVSGTSRSLGTGSVTVKNGGVLGLSAETNLAAGQKVAVETGGVLVVKNAGIQPANVIDSNPAKTTGGVLSLGTDYATPLNMSAIGNGQLYLGSTGTATYSAATLGAGTGGVYRLGGGSGPNSFNLEPSILIFSGTDNLFTGANSVTIGQNGDQLGDARRFSTVVLRNANNYTGGTTLTAGVLALGHDAALGSGSLTLAGGTLQSEGSPRAISNPVLFAADTSINGTDDLTLAGPVDLGGAARIVRPGTTARFTFANTVSNGSLTVQSGRLTLAGNNTFNGLTVGSAGVVEFSADQNLGAAGVPVTVNGGTLRSTTSLSLSRTIAFTGNGTLDSNGTMLTLSGPITGTRTVTKEGLGTLTLEGGSKAVLNYVVNAGTLQINGNGTASAIPVSLDTDATLSGNGSVGNTVVRAGSRVEPGTDVPGILHFNGDIRTTAGALFEFDLGPTIFDEIILHSGKFERIAGTGPLLIDIDDAGGLATGQTYTLFDWTTATPPTLTAADFALSGTPVDGTFQIVGTTLQFKVTQVPEPGSLALLAVAALPFMTRRRRSRSV